MQNKLFVGSLPYSMRDEDLEKMFAEYGKVSSAVVIMDRATNRSKGFGFVEYETTEEAEAAIKALNDSEVEGRKIVVNHARPREER
ncbi:MAG TPA: RNA-binding protein [Candidatus Saccharimonadales bacterium]